MHIAFSSDDSYATFLGVVIFSLLENNGVAASSSEQEKITIHVLDRDISKENKDAIVAISKRFNSEIRFLDMEKTESILQESVKMQTNHPRSLTSYYRLFLPSLLPDSVKKVIYMDCDSMVCGSLQGLWNTDIEGYDIAGVLDTVSVQNKAQVGLTEKDPYLNAGMLVINLARWRAENTQQKLLDFVLKHEGKVCHHDQGTINGVCLKKKVVHPRYNAMTPIFVMSRSQLMHYHSLGDYYNKKELKEATDHPVFVHFTPGLVDRPWIKGNFHPLRNQYKETQVRTHWKGMSVETPSACLEPWVKWMFRILPYWAFIRSLQFMRLFRPRKWLRQFRSGLKK